MLEKTGCSFLLACLLAQCTPTVQQDSPEATLNSIFTLARQQQTEPLYQFCDPQQDNDGDTDCLCALSSKYTPHQCPENSPNRLSPEQFSACLSEGEILHTHDKSPTLARVDIRLNRCGLKNETVTLVMRDGKWYLLSF